MYPNLKIWNWKTWENSNAKPKNRVITRTMICFSGPSVYSKPRYLHMNAGTSVSNKSNLNEIELKIPKMFERRYILLKVNFSNVTYANIVYVIKATDFVTLSASNPVSWRSKVKYKDETNPIIPKSFKG